MKTKSRVLFAATALVAAGMIPAAAYATGNGNDTGGSWQPEPVTYGVSTSVDTSVTMSDGVSIDVQVVYPTDLSTGARATGDFPVLLTQNPYGGDPTKAGDYFVQRGYIYVASAVRGTGKSGGQASWFDQRQGQDGAELVNWAAHSLAGSDGKVGLDGCSYLGVDQYYTAAAVGRDSALKEISPFCSNSNNYDDLNADGGIPVPFAAGIAKILPRGPQDNPSTDPLSQIIAQQANGGPDSYNDAFWQSRDFQTMMPQIIANGIPAITETGWKDIYPGGNLNAYVAAQNAYFHRPLSAPIGADEPVTGRYQAIVGPWTHGENVNGAVLENVKLEWFDTWLKNQQTGMADTATPLHLFENTASQWVDTAAWPASQHTETYQLGSNGGLSAGQASSDGTGTLNWAAASSTNSLTYTSAPLTHDQVLDGPSDVTVYAESTAPEVELTATLNLVAPDGTVVKQADGALLGSQRALDPWQSLYGTGNTLLSPVHPFTQQSQQPVVPGQTTRYDIGMLASFTKIPAGDRIQVVLTSQAPSNFHTVLAPTPQESANLANGVYTVEYGPHTPSTLNLPLTSPNQFTASPTNWGPSS